MDDTDRYLNALEQSESEPQICKFVNERSSTVRWHDTVEEPWQHGEELPFSQVL